MKLLHILILVALAGHAHAGWFWDTYDDCVKKYVVPAHTNLAVNVGTRECGVIFKTKEAPSWATARAQCIVESDAQATT